MTIIIEGKLGNKILCRKSSLQDVHFLWEGSWQLRRGNKCSTKIRQFSFSKQLSSIKMAFRRLRPHLSAMPSNTSRGISIHLEVAIESRTPVISSREGAPTRSAMQRLCNGSIILDMFSHSRIRRHREMYFSIVRRRACWAGLTIRWWCFRERP